MLVRYLVSGLIQRLGVTRFNAINVWILISNSLLVVLFSGRQPRILANVVEKYVNAPRTYPNGIEDSECNWNTIRMSCARVSDSIVVGTICWIFIVIIIPANNSSFERMKNVSILRHSRVQRSGTVHCVLRGLHGTPSIFVGVPMTQARVASCTVTYTFSATANLCMSRKHLKTTSITHSIKRKNEKLLIRFHTRRKHNTHSPLKSLRFLFAVHVSYFCWFLCCVRGSSYAT